jgi:hypothetical protein
VLGSHLLTNRLQPLGVVAGNESVVQRLEANAFPAKLAFGVFVPVQAKFGVVGKVRSELEEERTEVTVQTIPVILIDHRRGPHNPGIRLARFRVAPLFCPENRCLLLCFAEHHHAFRFFEPGQMLGHDVVLALSFAELHHRYVLLFGKPLHAGHKALRHRLHQRRRGEGMAAMTAEELYHPALILQGRNIHVQIHPVDALQLERDVLIQDFGYGL